MYRTQGVLALLALSVGLAQSFSWDVVMGEDNRLEFYNNGTLTHTEVISSAYTQSITSIIYDPVYNRVLISVLGPSIFSLDIATMKMQHLFTTRNNSDRWDGPEITGFTSLNGLAYDPVTETLFGIQRYLESIIAPVYVYSYSLKPGANDAVEENRLIELNEAAVGIAVDSCKGYIYWTTPLKIERARFDGSDREVVIQAGNRIGSTFDALSGTLSLRFSDLVIDQLTQKMYWIENKYTTSSILIKYLARADLNGNNRNRSKNALQTVTRKEKGYDYEFLTESKEFMYWAPDSIIFAKDHEYVRYFKPRGTNVTRLNCQYCNGIAVKYKVKDQTQGIRNCETLMCLRPTNPVPSNCDSHNDSTNASLLCVHGTKVSGESRCACTQGYIGERCEVPVCHNYCFQGDCSVSAEGQPKCSCNAGYSGERCEINACHGYCLNNGICSLNEESDPVCQCIGQYEGDRCDDKFLQTVSMLRDILNTDVTPATLGKGVKWTCAPTPV